MSFEMERDVNGDPIIKSPPVFDQSTQKVAELQQAAEEPIGDEREVTHFMPADVPEEPQEAPVETPQTQPRESKAEQNMRILRQTAERVERERDEAMARIRYMESQQLQARQQQPEPEEDLGIGNDELVEGKHLSKLGREVKQLKQQLKGYEQHAAEQAKVAAQALVEAKIKARFPDFDAVVTNENINQLRDHDPVYANFIAQSPDLYSQAVSAYNAIKKLTGDTRTYSDEQARIDRNKAKPRSTASISPQRGESPLSKANDYANGLTEELAAKLRKEMADNRRNF